MLLSPREMLLSLELAKLWNNKDPRWWLKSVDRLRPRVIRIVKSTEKGWTRYKAARKHLTSFFQRHPNLTFVERALLVSCIANSNKLFTAISKHDNNLRDIVLGPNLIGDTTTEDVKRIANQYRQFANYTDIIISVLEDKDLEQEEKYKINLRLDEIRKVKPVWDIEIDEAMEEMRDLVDEYILCSKVGIISYDGTDG